jgi:xanthosine utilization system XapX-like protein
MSQMFWGGVWGIVFALLVDRLPARWPIVVAGFLFGLCGPLLIGWTVVPAIRGGPLFAGWNPTRMLSSVLINGCFGIGVALIFTGLRRMVGGRARTA